MPEYDLEQVKADLNTIRAAAGISDAPTRDDLWGNNLVAAAGLVIVGWSLASHGVSQLWGLVAALLPASYVVGLRLRHRKTSGGSPQVRREFRDAFLALLMAIPFVAYVEWALRMKIPPMLVLATAVFFVGLLMLNGARKHPEMAPWCLVFMASALVVPSRTFSPITVIGLMLIVGGLTSAAIVAIRLRQGTARARSN